MYTLDYVNPEGKVVIDYPMMTTTTTTRLSRAGMRMRKRGKEYDSDKFQKVHLVKLVF